MWSAPSSPTRAVPFLAGRSCKVNKKEQLLVHATPADRYSCRAANPCAHHRHRLTGLDDGFACPRPKPFFVANLRHRAGETGLEPEAGSERRPREKRYGKETLRRAKTGRAEHCCVSSVQHHIGSPQKVSRQLVNGIIRHLGLPAAD